MKTPRELKQPALVEIVTALQQALYLDFDAEPTPVWDPDKPWNGAEVCDRLAEVLARHDLVPDAVLPVADDAP